MAFRIMHCRNSLDDTCHFQDDVLAPRFVGDVLFGEATKLRIYMENVEKRKCGDGCQYELVSLWTERCIKVQWVDNAIKQGKSALEIVKYIHGRHEWCDCKGKCEM